jgi:nicotinamidase-related amidase
VTGYQQFVSDTCRFLMKVRHSVFYATPLGYLLGQLGVRRVILNGQVTEQCIRYSALDAHVRHFDVVVAPTRLRISTPILVTRRCG